MVGEDVSIRNKLQGKGWHEYASWNTTDAPFLLREPNLLGPSLLGDVFVKSSLPLFEFGTIGFFGPRFVGITGLHLLLTIVLIVVFGSRAQDPNFWKLLWFSFLTLK